MNSTHPFEGQQSLSDDTTLKNPYSRGSHRYTIIPRGHYQWEPFIDKPHWFIPYLVLVEMAEYRHNPRRYALGRVWVLAQGQLVTSFADLKRRFSHLYMSTQNIRTFLGHLQNIGLINMITNKGGTIITICKYEELYQRSSKRNTPIKQGIIQRSSKVYNKPSYKQKYSNGKPLSESAQDVMQRFRQRQQEIGPS